jgi:hypothetical protein
MLRRSSPLKNALIVLLLLLLSIPTAYSRQIDDGYDPLLSPLAASLDGHVDVLVGRYEQTHSLLLANHVLTWMSNMPLTASKPSAPYVPEGVILAVQPSGQVGPEPVPPGRRLAFQEFYEEWLRAPLGRRIFISYSRADAAQAALVEKTLRAQKFVTFIYLADDGKPKIPLIEEQRIFKTADVHLVIHSNAASASTGVTQERWTFDEVMTARAEEPKVQIFGPRGCPSTMAALEASVLLGIRAEFIDIARSPDAQRRARQRNIQSWPMIEVNGEPSETSDTPGCRRVW